MMLKAPLHVVAVPVVLLVALFALRTASADTTHATGKLCGVSACADISPALAGELSQMMGANDTFSLVSKPKPHPYYKVRITADGTEWYLSKQIVWVPSKHLFRVKEHIRPTPAPYWRTGNSAYENQFTKVVRSGKVQPFPASRHYR